MEKKNVNVYDAIAEMGQLTKGLSIAFFLCDTTREKSTYRICRTCESKTTRLFWGLCLKKKIDSV